MTTDFALPLRSKASLLAGAGFTLFTAILVIVAMSTPIFGLLIYGVLYFASPFTWGWGLVAGLDAPWPVPRSYCRSLLQHHSPWLACWPDYCGLFTSSHLCKRSAQSEYVSQFHWPSWVSLGHLSCVNEHVA
jgi:hypothetical protein